MFGATLDKHPPRCSHGIWLDGSWRFDPWRMLVSLTGVCEDSLDIIFLGHSV